MYDFDQICEKIPNEPQITIYVPKYQISPLCEIMQLVHYSYHSVGKTNFCIAFYEGTVLMLYVLILLIKGLEQCLPLIESRSYLLVRCIPLCMKSDVLV